MTGDLEKENTDTHTHTQGDHPVKVKAEIRVMEQKPRSTEDRRQTTRSWEPAKHRLSLTASWPKEAIPRFQTSTQNSETINFRYATQFAALWTGSLSKLILLACQKGRRRHRLSGLPQSEGLLSPLAEHKRDFWDSVSHCGKPPRALFSVLENRPCCQHL